MSTVLVRKLSVLLLYPTLWCRPSSDSRTACHKQTGGVPYRNVARHQRGTLRLTTRDPPAAVQQRAASCVWYHYLGTSALWTGHHSTGPGSETGSETETESEGRGKGAALVCLFAGREGKKRAEGRICASVHLLDRTGQGRRRKGSLCTGHEHAGDGSGTGIQ